jgi:hypothetical protein
VMADALESRLSALGRWLFDWNTRMFRGFPFGVREFLLSLGVPAAEITLKPRQIWSKLHRIKGPAFVSSHRLVFGYSYLGDKETALSCWQKSAEIRGPRSLHQGRPTFRSRPLQPALQCAGTTGRTAAATPIKANPDQFIDSRAWDLIGAA